MPSSRQGLKKCACHSLVRATGTGIAYNAGRFATALGVFAAGALFTMLQGSYPLLGASCSLVYLLGAVVIFWAPDTTDKSLTNGTDGGDR